MDSWTKQIVLPSDQPAISIKEQLTRWLVPRRIRGNFRMERRILLNGTYQPTSTILKPGDILTMTWLPDDFEVATSNYVMDDSRPVDVLFENEDLIVVNKIKGVKTHPNSPVEDGTMMNFAQSYLQAQGKAAYMVHRLDGDTTGALIIAKNPYVVPMLNQMLRDKTIRRTYLAWVRGAINEPSGVITAAIGENPDDSRTRRVDGPNAVPAVTHWAKVHTVYQNTLVRLDLETGRTHQIRLHMQSIGHPLVGDPLYNPTDDYEGGLLLHAASIKIPLPFTNDLKSIGAPLPPSFPRNFK